MTSRARHWLLLTSLLARLCTAQEPALAPAPIDTPSPIPVVTIGTVSGQLNPQLTANDAVFSRYLDSQIPTHQFRVVRYDTIESMISAVDAGLVSFAFITPVAFVQLAQRHELRPLATVVQQVQGGLYPWLASSAFVRDDRVEVQTMADAHDQRVMALSPLALGGWLAALREWRALGIDEGQDFDELVFDFSYSNILQAVCSGRTDIGVLPTTMFLQMRAECVQPLRVLTLPSASANPRFPFAASSRIYPEVAFTQIGIGDEALVNRLTQALLSIAENSPEAQAINVAGFTAPLNYTPVVELMQEVGVAPFEGYGDVTLNQFVQQHRGKLALLMFFIAGVLVLAYGRNKILQRKVKQSELFRNQIFSRSQFAVVVVDARTFDFVDVNAAAVNLLGFRQHDDLIGKSPRNVLADIQYDGKEIGESLDQLRDLAEKDEGPLVIEWLLKRPSGELWDAEGHIVPFSYGNREFIQITLVDVTERKRNIKEREKMEQQLRHSQRLESIGRFSGAIAHDFNNLLTVINGYSELLLANSSEGDPQRTVYKEITQACSRAGDLTTQLLTFSRRRIARMEPLDVNKTIADSATMFRRLLGETISLRTSLQPNLGLTLADAGHLHQVLMNFVVNARDAMPNGGEFHLTTERCQIDARAAMQLNIEEGEYIRLIVRDTGTGMTREVQEKVFEPFFTTKGDRGNGFGLATTYGIVKQCRGGITFQSELGVGTTFTLYFPVTEDTVDLRPIQDTPAAPLSSGPRTVMVVEDEREVRIFACLLLQTAGFKVLEAESGIQALKLAQTHRGPIDLLFTDVVLGDISGSKMAEKFKLLFPATPVLFTSGYANDEIALHGVMQDRIAFIAKPYSPATLLARIRTLFEQGTPVT